jgi:predicted MPP superfamily phosphohydrolase
MVGVIIAVVCAAVALGLWGLFESQWVSCSRREIEVPGLPVELDGFRLLHVSDLHLGAVSLAWLSARRAQNWLAGREFDLVAITGDLVSAKRGVPRLQEFLATLRADLGVIAVLGNHDVSVTRDPFSSASGTAFDELEGMTLLRDSAVSLARGSVSIRVAGLDALSYLRATTDPTTLTGEEDFRILLSHYPTVVNRAAHDSFELVLAGHVHGGQICLPTPRGRLRLAHPGAPYPEGVFSVHEGETTLVVSRGLGTTFVPFRLLARPELTELVLRAPRLAE